MEYQEMVYLKDALEKYNEEKNTLLAIGYDLEARNAKLWTYYHNIERKLKLINIKNNNTTNFIIFNRNILDISQTKCAEEYNANCAAIEGINKKLLYLDYVIDVYNNNICKLELEGYVF